MTNNKLGAYWWFVAETYRGEVAIGAETRQTMMKTVARDGLPEGKPAAKSTDL
ncbi:hypothetical protein G4O51_06150 [Candidatus Bathyarchaeota archaeon A05DMB-2]|nr:hypothetical protein [Candidatus Bathyarchaeota archaeon A05DMB-2]